MRLPRDISGTQLARLLRQYGYEQTRQTGSHMRLTSVSQGSEHHITIPNHDSLRVGTLNGVLQDVAVYLGRSRDDIAEELFG